MANYPPYGAFPWLVDTINKMGKFGSGWDPRRSGIPAWSKKWGSFGLDLVVNSPGYTSEFIYNAGINLRSGFIKRGHPFFDMPRSLFKSPILPKLFPDLVGQEHWTENPVRAGVITTGSLLGGAIGASLGGPMGAKIGSRAGAIASSQIYDAPYNFTGMLVSDFNEFDRSKVPGWRRGKYKEGGGKVEIGPKISDWIIGISGRNRQRNKPADPKTNPVVQSSRMQGGTRKLKVQAKYGRDGWVPYGWSH